MVILYICIEQEDTSKINRLMIHSAAKLCWEVRDRYAFVRIRMQVKNICKAENTVTIFQSHI